MKPKGLPVLSLVYVKFRIVYSCEQRRKMKFTDLDLQVPNPRWTKRHAIRRPDALHATSAVVELGDDIIRLIRITDSNLLF